LYKSIFKPLFFLLDAEKAHHLVFSVLKILGKIPGFLPMLRMIYGFESPELGKTVFGLHFKNPVGLAAGMDKNAKYLHEMKAIGFGYIEIGTVTPLPQAGNPKPRMFRLKKDNALINRMGFNNDGLETVIKNLRKRPKGLIVGGNIGKNKITPNEKAVDDYVKCFEGLFPYVDYFVVNVSSPNTPGLRDLQEKEPLTKILNQLQQINNEKQSPKPVLLKIAPDLTASQLDDIISIVHQTKIAGLIATNTTISRNKLQTSKEQIEKTGNGGLSGEPLFEKSTGVLNYLARQSGKQIQMIGVGGVHDAATAKAKLGAGAELIQVFTGFVYKGPGLIKRIKKGLIRL
jgi:dihydroorotate dehydrogenase